VQLLGVDVSDRGLSKERKDLQSQASTRRDGQENRGWTTHQRQGRRKLQGAKLEHLGDFLNGSLSDTSSLIKRNFIYKK